ncbi:MAG: rod shape-determining protein MreC [Bacteroidia bacterium]|nr:rod shape-determining protein MreC [Bacteroidia bacterium]
MKNLFRLIYRYHVLLLFVLLETLSLSMVVTYNNYQRATFLDSSNFFTGTLFEGFSSFFQIFEFRQVNIKMAEENAVLRAALQEHLLKTNHGTYKSSDSIYLPRIAKDSSLKAVYRFTTARIINNSINQQHNFITLNKGRHDGVKANMGVIANGQVVGLVFNVSENFSTVISLLNSRWKISAKIKRNDYFGSLSWDGKDYRRVQLNEVPYHVPVQNGDTVVTTGYSSSFPEGLVIGTISDFSIGTGSNFYRIEVMLAADFKNLVIVGLVENKQLNEIKQLESLNKYGN